MTSTLCAVEGCGRNIRCRGWCKMHYDRWYRLGDPLARLRVANGEATAEAWKYLLDVVIPYDGDGCLDWPLGKSRGYGRISKAGVTQYVSRVVCEMIHGQPPTPKHEAAHNCGKGHLGCVSPGHLSWKTPKENQADKRIHGTQPLGEQVISAKLTADDVATIRSLRGVIRQVEVAEMFGISGAHVSKIQTNRLWSHIPNSSPSSSRATDKPARAISSPLPAGNIHPSGRYRGIA